MTVDRELVNSSKDQARDSVQVFRPAQCDGMRVIAKCCRILIITLLISVIIITGSCAQWAQSPGMWTNCPRTAQYSATRHYQADITYIYTTARVTEAAATLR